MKLFVKENNIKIHEESIPAISEDLFYALKLNTQVGTFDKCAMALGEHENLIFSEVRTDDVISMAVLDKKKKVLKGFRMNPATRFSGGAFSDENFEDRVAVLGIVLRVMDRLNPFINKFAQFESENSGKLSSDKVYDLKEILNDIESFVVSELYSNKNSEIAAIQKPTQEINISQVETGLLMPSKVIMGQFVGFKSSTKVRKAVKVSDIESKFTLNPERVLTEDEKNMMFNIPEYYSVSSNVLSIAEKIKASWDGDPNMRKINVLMEGPAGTGKTMDSKVLSRLLGLPYTKITCFSDMDSSDVTGAILPVAEEGIDIPMPSDDEIYFDPAGCYERITGKRLTEQEAVDITEADVRNAINEVYESYYSSQEGKNSPRYIYYASEIVKAFENGWLCEVQEPTCVADAAVLLILNSALEKEGVINLPQRTVKRHPECIFVMTTNRDYEGCRPLNQALRDRFNITKKVVLPSTEEQMERLSSATGCTNESFLRVVVESVNSLNDYLHNNGINAAISLRGMQDFVMDCVRGFDLRESVMEDMIYKVSTDDEEVAEMENFLELSTSLFSASL
jgi:hypothetical protein